MIKWVLAFIFMVLVLGLALDVFAQVIVLSPDGTVKDIVIMPMPTPTR
jgi:hypothetical protein